MVPEETSPSQPDAYVRVRGAREHNLQDVDVDIPRNALVVFSGVSGSGKSSLAFGTLFAEAQHRYLESVSPYARRLIDQVGVPAVDSIEGLPPAVALQQQRGTPSLRSSVGTVSTLSNLLRVLYSRAGHYPARQPMLFAEDFSPHTPQGACPHCHGQGRLYEVTEQSMVPDDALTIRQRAIAAWPTAWGGQNLRDILVTLGFDIDTPWRALPKKQRQWILFTDETPTVPVYAGFTPAETQQALRDRLEPSYQGTFSSARRHVLHTFSTSQSAMMRRRASRFMVSRPCEHCHGKRLKPASLRVTFAGLDIAEASRLPLEALAELLRAAADGHAGGAAEPAEVPRGATVSRAASSKASEARRLRGEVSHARAPDIRRTAPLSEEKRIAAQRIARDMRQRAAALCELGLGHLALDRETPTLSPGEMQRLRLATQLSSQLFGVVYVLDEPSAGLHPQDGQALVTALKRLQGKGNSIFMVEHDLALMRQADWLVDVGPWAGQYGGKVLYSGPPGGLASVEASQTGAYLFGRRVPDPRALREPAGWLQLRDITRNNVRGVSARIPLGCLCAVTGVSGSGKSSLVSLALVELLGDHLGVGTGTTPDDDAPDDGAPGITDIARASGSLGGDTDRISRMVVIDQRPIGRTPRSNLATYTGLFDAVRALFAATPAARRRRYKAGRFSFNVPQGRCDTCDGEGSVSVELLFMPSAYAPCPACKGARYNTATLAVQWNGHSIADILGLTVEEACGVFSEQADVLRALHTLRDIGLGYLRLGQPATELSGGEAQRIKLATELQRSPRGATLYVLDEPTTGLHPADVDRLFNQLDQLVQAGHSVVMVEHEMRIVARCDWMIDVGPGAGDAGGRIVAEGPPARVCAAGVGATAPHLRSHLST